MDDNLTMAYAGRLSRLVQIETVSQYGQTDLSKFYIFHEALKREFPAISAACRWEEYQGSLLLKWPGRDPNKTPILLMNHHDVVDAAGAWKYAPFSGDIAEGKVWGRGTLDTKGGLFAMLQAADELVSEGFVPAQDVHFESACTEEIDGSGADHFSKLLQERGMRFRFVLDEGGMIVFDPIGGSEGVFAMVGVGEKGCADLKFIARSNGGHASTPPKNSPLVRLGKFMAEVERKNLFDVQVSPTVREMFLRMAPTVNGPLKNIMAHPDAFNALITNVLPRISETAGAMLQTTIAFTMAQGSEGTNVLPQEAWVIGNMRFSHHQGGAASIAAVTELAKKYDISVEVLDPGFESPVSDFNSEGFKLVERAVAENFPGVRTSPYLMTGASDARYFSRVSDCCLRFAPFRISDEQLASIHGLNENVDLSALVPAVKFYKYILREA